MQEVTANKVGFAQVTQCVEHLSKTIHQGSFSWEYRQLQKLKPEDDPRGKKYTIKLTLTIEEEK